MSNKQVKPAFPLIAALLIASLGGSAYAQSLLSPTGVHTQVSPINTTNWCNG